MRNFIVGVIVTLVVLILGGCLVAFLGFVDTSAELRPGNLETFIASEALDASVGRHAAKLPNPVPETDANLLEGMTLYTMNCTGCHGTLDKSPSLLGPNFYPPAPNLVNDPPDDPEWHTFYVIKHGIRWTGMPAWGRGLKDDEIWKVSSFLTRLKNLPPAVQEKMPKPAASPGQ